MYTILSRKKAGTMSSSSSSSSKKRQARYQQRTTSRSADAWCSAMLLFMISFAATTFISPSQGFAPFYPTNTHQSASPSSSTRPTQEQPPLLSSLSTRGARIYMATIKISKPSSDEAAQMGIREWPQQLRQGTWTEFVTLDKTVVRYILDGSGSLKSTDEDQAITKITPLVPGTLVEVTGTATLEWKANDKDGKEEEGLIVLTPAFEEGGLFLGVAVVVIAIFGALLGGGGFY